VVTELMSPIDALFNTRSRAEPTRSPSQGIRRSNAPDKRRRYFHFGLKDEKFAPPWDGSVCESRRSIDEQRRELIQSDPKFQELLAVLK